MKHKLLRNAATPKTLKKQNIQTTPSRSVSLLSSREGMVSRSPATRELQLSILEKCLKNSATLMSQTSAIDQLLRKSGDSVKEFQLSGILRKMKQMERLCEQIEEKLGGKEPRSTSPFRMERKKLQRKDLKKIVKQSKYPAQKKIFELVKRIRMAIPLHLKNAMLLSAKQIRTHSSRAFSSQVRRDSIQKMIPSLISRSLKTAQTAYLEYQKKGLFELMVFQRLAGIKLTKSAWGVVLAKKEKEHLTLFDSKTQSFTVKINSGLIASSLALQRTDYRQSQNILGEVLKIIHSELLRSKRDKTKILLRSQLENALTLLGWSAFLAGHPKKAAVYLQEAVQKGAQKTEQFNLLLEYGLLKISHNSKKFEGEEGKVMQLLKFIHYEGKQLCEDLETASQVLNFCPDQYKHVVFLVLFGQIGKTMVLRCQKVMGSLPTSLRTYLGLIRGEEQRLTKIRRNLSDCKQDSVLLMYKYVKEQVKEKSHTQEILMIVGELEELFGGTELATVKFWRARVLQLQHQHRLALIIFDQVFEGVSVKKQTYIKDYRVELDRLKDIIKIAAFNRDTIKKSAPGFADLEPFWEELLRLCLNKTSELDRFQLFYQKYPSRFQAAFLLWFSLIKNKSSLQRARTLLSEMASSSSRYSQQHLHVDDALLFRLVGKNYAESLTREQLFGLMELKTTINENDLNLASVCVKHLISQMNLPILHYFMLSIAQKQATKESVRLETLERVGFQDSQSYLKTQDWGHAYHRAKSALLWSEILYLSKEEQASTQYCSWKGVYKRARDMLVAQNKEKVLHSKARAIDFYVYQYKL